MPKDKAWDSCDVDAVADSIRPGNLTPTTREACEAAGVVPEEMIAISKEEFKERQGVDLPPKHIMKMRWEHHEKLRKQKIGEMLEARKQIPIMRSGGRQQPGRAIARGWKCQGPRPVNDLPEHRPSPQQERHGPRPWRAISPVSNLMATMLEREKKEIEKIKRKQQKELEQMMEYELKLQAIREDNERKVVAQKEREKAQELEL